MQLVDLIYLHVAVGWPPWCWPLSCYIIIVSFLWWEQLRSSFLTTEFNLCYGIQVSCRFPLDTASLVPLHPSLYLCSLPYDFTVSSTQESESISPPFGFGLIMWLALLHLCHSIPGNTSDHLLSPGQSERNVEQKHSRWAQLRSADIWEILYKCCVQSLSLGSFAL